MITDNELLELQRLVRLRDIEKARDNLLDFTRFTMPSFSPSEFHCNYYDVLDQFAKKEIKRLIVSCPPQHGKSEGSSRRLASFLFGINPNLRIALASYNATFASKFNRQIQRIIDSPDYKDVFPESRLATHQDNYIRTAEEFEIVGKEGFFKSVGVGGGLTGNSVDIAIMDDLYKDYADATSPVISERVWDWYTTVVRTRMHNDSQELIVFTRWDENDLVGRLEKAGKVVEYTGGEINLLDDQFLKINFEAIKTGPATELDNREKGQPLWGEKHNLEKLEGLKKLDPQKFESLYQGNPINKEGLMYSEFQTYKHTPQFKTVEAYIDTADTGKDYLCCIVYGVPMGKHENVYVLDVLYTQAPMEETEGLVSDTLTNNNVRVAHIESNNGGRGFARVVNQYTPNTVTVKTFAQTANKESRIYSNSASVNRTVFFPSDWSKWSEFYRDITHHKKDAKNKHDDAPDALTGVYEKGVIIKSKGQILW